MQITSGLTSNQVIQREKNKAAVTVSGKSKNSGNVVIRIVSKKSKSAWKKAGRSVKGLFTVKVSGLKTGGPYTVEFKIEGSTEGVKVSNVFVGDLWIMGGQSNMQGVGLLADAVKPHPMVQMFTSADKWMRAKEPVNFNGWSKYKAYRREDPFLSKEESAKLLKENIRGTGPGLAFARELYERVNVPIGLIPCALGGSSLTEWSPKKKKLGPDSLYGALLERVKLCGGNVKGMIWYQGCSDAHKTDSPKFTKNMQNLISSFRKDLKLKTLPIVMVQIANFFCSGRWPNAIHEGWSSIREQQRHLPKKIKNTTIVATIDLTLDDGIHISGKSHVVLGKRLAAQADRLVYGKKKIKPAPQVKKISWTLGEKISGQEKVLAVTFENVSGKLLAPDNRPMGFSIRNKKHEDMPTIYKTEIRNNVVLLYTEVRKEDTPKVNLFYGYGKHTYCNLRDDSGSGVLAFGPVKIPPQKK